MKRRIALGLGIISALLVGSLLAVVVLVFVLRSAFSSQSSACDALGRPGQRSVASTWEIRHVMTGETDRTYAVSNLFEVPPTGRGIRVDAVVFGSRNAPIFPDAVSLQVIDEAHLTEALRHDAEQATGPTPANPALLVPVGVGVKAINENVALQPGSYRLVTSDDRRVGQLDVRVCT